MIIDFPTQREVADQRRDIIYSPPITIEIVKVNLHIQNTVVLVWNYLLHKAISMQGRTKSTFVDTRTVGPLMV